MWRVWTVMVGRGTLAVLRSRPQRALPTPTRLQDCGPWPDRNHVWKWFRANFLRAQSPGDASFLMVVQSPFGFLILFLKLQVRAP